MHDTVRGKLHFCMTEHTPGGDLHGSHVPLKHVAGHPMHDNSMYAKLARLHPVSASMIISFGHVIFAVLVLLFCSITRNNLGPYKSQVVALPVLIFITGVVSRGK